MRVAPPGSYRAAARLLFREERSRPGLEQPLFRSAPALEEVVVRSAGRLSGLPAAVESPWRSRYRPVQAEGGVVEAARELLRRTDPAGAGPERKRTRLDPTHL